MMRLLFSILFLGLFFQNMLFSQSTVRVENSLSTDEIKIGEQVTVNVRLFCGSSDSVRWISLKDTVAKHIELVQRLKIDTIYDSTDLTKKQIHQQFILTSFDSGAHVIEPWVIYVNNIPYETQALLLEVHTVPVDTSKAIFDIRSPFEVHYTFIDWLKDYWEYVVSGFVLLALLIYGVYRYIQYRKKQTNTEPERAPEPILPAHVVALARLEALKEQKLWQQGNFKEYHSVLSEIVRWYIEQRFHVQALEQTSFEINRALRTHDISPECKEKLKQLLTLSDLVKFAKEYPLPQENEQSMESAFYFIQHTLLSETNTPHA